MYFVCRVDVELRYVRNFVCKNEKFAAFVKNFVCSFSVMKFAVLKFGVIMVFLEFSYCSKLYEYWFYRENIHKFCM